ncbi:MAG: hypothetical protein ACXWQO_10865 [Bdellovibrionota bacterium]
MERSQDLRKKYPLLVVGNVPFPGHEGEQLTSLKNLTRESWEGAFICFSCTENDLREKIDEAHALGIPFDQSIIYVEKFPSAFLPPSGCVILEFHPDESGEDFRHRLMGKIETQRQQRLHHELERAESSGALSLLPDAQVHAAFECARVAHALAYLYDLPPSRHSLTIRLALCAGRQPLREKLLISPCSEINFPENEDANWQPGLLFELVLAYCAELTLGACENPAMFREAFRVRSALLPFKTRNELKTQVEKILEPFWGGKNAA